MFGPLFATMNIREAAGERQPTAAKPHFYIRTSIHRHARYYTHQRLGEAGQTTACTAVAARQHVVSQPSPVCSSRHSARGGRSGGQFAGKSRSMRVPGRSIQKHPERKTPTYTVPTLPTIKGKDTENVSPTRIPRSLPPKPSVAGFREGKSA